MDMKLLELQKFIKEVLGTELTPIQWMILDSIADNKYLLLYGLRSGKYMLFKVYNKWREIISREVDNNVGANED